LKVRLDCRACDVVSYCPHNLKNKTPRRVNGWGLCFDVIKVVGRDLAFGEYKNFLHCAIAFGSSFTTGQTISCADTDTYGGGNICGRFLLFM